MPQKKKRKPAYIRDYTFILSVYKVDNFLKKHKKNVCLWIKKRICVENLIFMWESYPQLSFSYALIHENFAKTVLKKGGVDKVIHNGRSEK